MATYLIGGKNISKANYHLSQKATPFPDISIPLNEMKFLIIPLLKVKYSKMGISH